MARLRHLGGQHSLDRRIVQISGFRQLFGPPMLKSPQHHFGGRRPTERSTEDVHRKARRNSVANLLTDIATRPRVVCRERLETSSFREGETIQLDTTWGNDSIARYFAGDRS